MESSVGQDRRLPVGNDIEFIALPLHQTRNWLRFLGVMSILEGVISVISIFGILIAWLPIWMGVVLFQAAGDAEGSFLRGDPTLLASANRRLKTYIILRAVTILIEIVIAMIGIFFVLSLGMLSAINI